MIKDAINQLVNGVDVNLIDFREVFDEIFSGLSEVSQSASFLTVLKTKELNNELYFSAITSARDANKYNGFLRNNDDSIESVVFNEEEKFFDISFGMDIICSASGLKVAKYSYDYPNFNNKAFEILKKCNVNIPDFSVDFSCSFEKTGFIYANLSNDDPFFKYSRELINNLPFDNMLFKVSKMLNPFGVKNQYIGVKTRKEVEIWANIALKLNNLNTLVVSSDDSPMIGLCAESFVAEAWKNKIFTYVLTPDLLGFKSCDKKDLECQSVEENLSDLHDIFQNKLKNSKYDILVLNSGLALYIAKKADSLIDGINLAKKIVDDGLAQEKLNQIIKNYS